MTDELGGHVLLIMLRRFNGQLGLWRIFLLYLWIFLFFHFGSRGRQGEHAGLCQSGRHHISARQK